MRKIITVMALLVATTAGAADWRSVRVVTDPAAVSKCEFIAQVENRFSGGNRNVARKRMLRQAARRGATHVLIHEEEHGKEWAKALFLGYTTTGEAYKCADKQ